MALVIDHQAGSAEGVVNIIHAPCKPYQNQSSRGHNSESLIFEEQKPDIVIEYTGKLNKIRSVAVYMIVAASQNLIYMHASDV